MRKLSLLALLAALWFIFLPGAAHAQNYSGSYTLPDGTKVTYDVTLNGNTFTASAQAVTTSGTTYDLTGSGTITYSDGRYHITGTITATGPNGTKTVKVFAAGATLQAAIKRFLYKVYYDLTH
ncbi:MAG TPA: hypothetical protein VFA07_08025 [Chthonomonadaceae bacterium]|nr:hypothetical protein [Chthonomonadaceae bacterium]